MVISIVVVLSCSGEQEKPEWLLGKDQMIAFLIDVHITEAKLTKLGITRDSARVLFNEYEKRLYEKHNIDDSVYYKSYHHYLEHVTEMKEIYDAVTDSLNYREQKLKK
ncbi:DUF4296 domain-containing protein [Fulvivirgaceae bacterium BMA10]|uniref:DUF4296 domain-containing protein n=1 Tax=Splendidivirga corallicola TaxID=3051826 RepID=A0ABT8KPD7_9BACT|nr:DUF4296 domain-containing protein [Fulvivirgaceae bacterium BMA10]